MELEDVGGKCSEDKVLQLDGQQEEKGEGEDRDDNGKEKMQGN